MPQDTRLSLKLLDSHCCLHHLCRFLGLKLSKEEEAHWKCVRLGLGQKDEEPVVEADGSGGEGCTGTCPYLWYSCVILQLFLLCGLYIYNSPVSLTMPP